MESETDSVLCVESETDLTGQMALPPLDVPRVVMLPRLHPTEGSLYPEKGGQCYSGNLN